MVYDFKTFVNYLLFKTIGTISFVRRIEWPIMINWLELKKNEKILDIACGEGSLTLKIAKKGCTVHGIDISFDAIKRAKYVSKQEKIYSSFEVGNAENLPYKNNSFDKIVCSSSLEHFINDITSLKEMYRVVKPNGLVVLTVDSFTYPIDKRLKEIHKNRHRVIKYYSSKTLNESLKKSGFNIKKDKYLLSSPITSYFIKNFTIQLKDSKVLFYIVSLIAYPLCIISEKFFSKKNVGYSLIALATK